MLPTCVSGDVARLRLTVQSRRDAPLEIEPIEVVDVEGEATLRVTHGGGDTAIDPKFEIETTSGPTDAVRRIHLRLLEPGSQLQVKGELRLPLHHPDLDELVLHWTAICRGP